MKASIKLFSWWVAVASGAILVMIAPFTLKGVGIVVIGAGLLVFGLVPIIRKRKAEREQNQDQTP